MSNPGTRKHTVVARLGLLLLATLLFLSVVEFVVASLDVAPPPPDPIVVWNPARDEGLDSPAGEFRFHPHWLWEPRPGVVVYGQPINRGAYRGAYYPPERGERLRIATLGDSTTYGFRLAEDVAWPRFLETLLRKTGNEVEVLNFGVIGFTAVQGLPLFRERVASYAPDVVIAAFGAVNEMYPALPGLDDDGKIERVNGVSQRIRQFLTRYDTFRLLSSLLVREGAAAADPATDPAGSDTCRVSPERFEAVLTELNHAVAAAGARLVLVSPPRRLDGEETLPGKGETYTAIIHRVAEREAIPLADVHARFRELERETFGEQATDREVASRSELFLDPWHPSALGHRAYAVVVGETLAAAGLLPKRN